MRANILFVSFYDALGDKWLQSRRAFLSNAIDHIAKGAHIRHTTGETFNPLDSNHPADFLIEMIIMLITVSKYTACSTAIGERERSILRIKLYKVPFFCSHTVCIREKAQIA